ncbi:hypothetical protein V3C99_009105 [Haemonchus contortus]|uniref:Ovule protein n=1 Tax=Haemonchus contortus TaxID=6289 RepID=A0A7I4YKG0_HAECO
MALSFPFHFEASSDASSYVSISEQASPVITTPSTHKKTSPFYHLSPSVLRLSPTTTTSFIKSLVDG